MAESKMRWEQAAAEICGAVENSAAKIARNAADNLYETVMVSVQDYLALLKFARCSTNSRSEGGSDGGSNDAPRLSRKGNRGWLTFKRVV